MQRLPWFIQNEIIDYLVSFRSEFCLVNKQWFTYSAGRFMRLKGKLIFGKKEPSEWFKLAERLQLSSFLQLHMDFLRHCHKIKRVDFKFKNQMPEIPKDFIQLLRNFSLETIYLKASFPNVLSFFQSLLQALSSEVKYLYLELGSKTYLFDNFFKLSFTNIVVFEVNHCSDPLVFERIQNSMPKLEILDINVNIINSLPSKNILVFNKLKKLHLGFYYLKYPPDNLQVDSIFEYDFPVLKVFKLKAIVDVIDFTKLSVSMPKLKNLHLELYTQKSILSKFPVLPLPQLEELTLNFLDKSENNIGLHLNYLPQLRQLVTNEKISIIDSKNSFLSKMYKIEFHDFKKFTLPDIRKHLPNLTKLGIDCAYLKNELHKIFQFCDLVSELTLINLDNRININLLPPGPFKTTRLELKGVRFNNNQFIVWLNSKFHLNQLILDYYCYKKLHIQVDNLSNIKCFHFNRRPLKSSADYQVKNQYKQIYWGPNSEYSNSNRGGLFTGPDSDFSIKQSDDSESESERSDFYLEHDSYSNESDYHFEGPNSDFENSESDASSNQSQAILIENGNTSTEDDENSMENSASDSF